jgi:tRNA (mo5U34)-methyltransferase
MNYTQFLSSLTHFDKINSIILERKNKLNRKSTEKFQIPYNTLTKYKAKFTDFSTDTITIGKKSEVSKNQLEEIKQALQMFMPWRKGPFNIFGIDIDAEWKSNNKWNRIKPFLPCLKNKVIADIGCNNGYYMFKMAHYNPKLVLGFDPTIHYYYTFKSLNAMANCENLQFELLGVEHLHLFPNTFDVIFLMGILYHHPSPIDLLKKVLIALKKGGTLVLETQGIPGDEPVALFPEKRYAKVPGTYFVPTKSCLLNFVKRSGFKNSNLFYSHKMSSDEQRQTKWMTFQSYKDFVDKDDENKTVEGYPAPIRIYLTAEKQ